MLSKRDSCYDAPVSIGTPDEVTRDLQSTLVGRQDLAAVYLFGSQARGEGDAASDLDLAVIFQEPRPSGLDGACFALATALSTALGVPVDVVDMETTDSDLVHRVLRDGRLVIEHNARRRIAVEVKRRAEYFDMLPFRRAYRAGAGR